MTDLDPSKPLSSSLFVLTAPSHFIKTELHKPNFKRSKNQTTRAYETRVNPSRMSAVVIKP